MNEKLKLINAVRECQEILAKAIVPESGISDSDVVSDILGVLDDRHFVEFVNELESLLAHYHVSSNDGTDICKECGLDLRNKIHHRIDHKG